MIVPAPYKSNQYEGILDWFKHLFSSPTIEDLPPEQKAKIQQAIKSAQIRGILIGAVAGGLLVYFLTKGKSKPQPVTKQGA